MALSLSEDRFTHILNFLPSFLSLINENDGRIPNNFFSATYINGSLKTQIYNLPSLIEDDNILNDIMFVLVRKKKWGYFPYKDLYNTNLRVSPIGSMRLKMQSKLLYKINVYSRLFD